MAYRDMTDDWPEDRFRTAPNGTYIELTERLSTK